MMLKIQLYITEINYILRYFQMETCLLICNNISHLSEHKRFFFFLHFKNPTYPKPISLEEIERIMSGQEFKEGAELSDSWRHGYSNHSSPGNSISEGGQTLSFSTLSTSRSVDVSTCSVSCRDQCSSPQLTHSFLLCKYPVPPSTGRRLKTQSHTLTAQLLAAEDLTPLATPMIIEEGYNVTQSELLALLCRIADELLFRQIVWLKRLPFYSDLSIKDCTRLLGASWHHLILLSSLTVHSGQILGELANITHQYTPSSLTLFGEDAMEVMESLNFLFRKFQQLNISNEEYSCLKTITLLNQDMAGLCNTSTLEQISERYWSVCRDLTERFHPHRPKRFSEIITCLSEIRHISGKMMAVPLEQLPLLFKAVLYSCTTNQNPWLTSSSTSKT
uniref:Nuclear receptor subfamily 6, group A, member 1b n=1 Tax=Cyprinus carpio TaxID=7962 RepID=A0A8C2CQF6_CYPCA